MPDRAAATRATGRGQRATYAGGLRILLVTQYFAPERTAASLRLLPFATGLAARGHDVDVIAEVPSHPEGVVHPGYGGSLIDRREIDGVRVRYAWAYATPSKAVAARLASYASYTVMGTLAGLRAPRPDVVLASSPPLTVGAIGVALSRRHRAPLVLDIRDLWPAFAESLGVVKNRPMLRAARRLERGVYDAAAAITTTTEPFREHIERSGGEEKTFVIPNGTTDNWIGMSRTEVDRADLGLPADTFLWTYAGNLGLAYDLETAIAAAELLGDGFTLLLLGDGRSRPALEAAASSRPEASVIFHDSVPPEEVSRYMRTSDAMLVAVPATRGTLAVKLYDSCAVGRPVIVFGEGETARVAREEGAALTVPPRSAAELAEAVRSLAADRALRERLASAGVGFAERNRREAQIEPLEAVLTAAASDG